MDWRQYESDASMIPSSYLDSFLVDDLENLTGLWNLFPFNRGGEGVADDPEAIEGDLAAIGDVPNTDEVEEGELSIVSPKIPTTSFGSTRRSSRKFPSRE